MKTKVYPKTEPIIDDYAGYRLSNSVWAIHSADWRGANKVPCTDPIHPWISGNKLPCRFRRQTYGGSVTHATAGIRLVRRLLSF